VSAALRLGDYEAEKAGELRNYLERRWGIATTSQTALRSHLSTRTRLEESPIPRGRLRKGLDGRGLVARSDRFRPRLIREGRRVFEPRRSLQLPRLESPRLSRRPL
jgi:hypothetical protein